MGDAGSGYGADDGLSEVVAAVRAGDEGAFRQLYRTVQPGLLRYLRGLVGDDAEDVASETWLQIARDVRTFRDQGVGFRGWAATVARHRALDHLRKQRRRPATAVPSELLAEVADQMDTADEAIAAAGTNSAIALIASLPRDQAEAILLRTVVGLDAPSAAKVLGKRPGAVRTAAWRGLRKLAQRLDAEAVAHETVGPPVRPASHANTPGHDNAPTVPLPLPPRSASGVFGGRQ